GRIARTARPTQRNDTEASRRRYRIPTHAGASFGRSSEDLGRRDRDFAVPPGKFQAAGSFSTWNSRRDDRRSVMFAALFIGAGMLTTAAPGHWETLARATFAEMVAGEWPKVAARFDAKMKAGLPIEKLADGWTSVAKQAGAFREVRKVTVTEQGAMHLVVLAAAFEKANLDVRMAFDGEGKIGGL